ncbi:MAG: hypothetical protein HYV15_04695 [Elusimicrobia bacterium]|nr:hypothetical protein [Elusimicrobiota bacterium]
MLRRPEAPPLGPRLRRAAEAVAAAAAAFAVLSVVGLGGGEVPLRFVLRAAGRPVVAHVAKVGESKRGAYVAYQYEAAKDYWPTVEEKTVPPGVRDGDRLKAHAIGGRVGLARLDDDGGRGTLPFLLTAALSLFVGAAALNRPSGEGEAQEPPGPGRLKIGGND